MNYDVIVLYEGAGKVNMRMNGDFKAIHEVIYLITDSALLEELVVEKVKEKDV